MQFLTYEEAERALFLFKIICERADTGLGVYLGPEDAELAALGFKVIVLISEHAPYLLETATESG